MGRDSKQSELEGITEKSSGRSRHPSEEIIYNKIPSNGRYGKLIKYHIN